MDAGQYEEAIAAFTELEGYKDSTEKIIFAKKQIIKNCNIGDAVYFGNYEQNNDTNNGKEPVELIILDKQDGKVLLISKYSLDAQPYNEEDEDVTWETCTLRTWLNNDFMNEAFSAEEQSMIAETTLVNADNPEYGTDGGSDTTDKIFLLSIEEEAKLPVARDVEATEYAKANGAFRINDNNNPWWWLRSPGKHQYLATLVYGDDVYDHGIYVNSGTIAVRPALWINVEE